MDIHLERYRETHDAEKRSEPGFPEVQDRRQTDHKRHQAGGETTSIPTEATKAARQGCL